MPTVLLSLNIPYNMKPGEIVALPVRVRRIYSTFGPLLLTQGAQSYAVNGPVKFVDETAVVEGRFLKNGEPSVIEVVARE